MISDDTPDCFRAHLGLWAIEPLYMRQAIAAIQANLWPMQAAVSREERLYGVQENIAIVRIVGPIQKGLSKFGGTSTILTRRAIGQALADDAIEAIMLAIDSPGGSVAGVQDLADTVARASARKPVVAYIEDLGASAAYWIASQAQRITVNTSGMVGSIGVFTLLEDSTGLAERAGIRIIPVTTGPFKTMGAPGTPITEEHIAEVQRQVDGMAALFFGAVKRGRKWSDRALAQVADGRIWIGPEAQALGLVDGVQTFDAALQDAARMRPRRRMAAASVQLAQMRATWEMGLCQ